MAGLMEQIYLQQLKDQAPTDYGTGWGAITKAMGESGHAMGNVIGGAFSQQTPQEALMEQAEAITAADTAAKLAALKAKGTPMNKALEQARDEMMGKYGPTAGNDMFLAEQQRKKEAVQSASVNVGVGTYLFKEGEQSRREVGDTLEKAKSAAQLFKEAKAGSAAAGTLSENIITSVFGGAAKAQTEIARIAASGGFVENIGDWVSGVFTGVKTQEHYDSFLKVLDIY